MLPAPLIKVPREEISVSPSANVLQSQAFHWQGISLALILSWLSFCSVSLLWYVVCILSNHSFILQSLWRANCMWSQWFSKLWSLWKKYWCLDPHSLKVMERFWAGAQGLFDDDDDDDDDNKNGSSACNSSYSKHLLGARHCSALRKLPHLILTTTLWTGNIIPIKGWGNFSMEKLNNLSKVHTW